MARPKKQGFAYYSIDTDRYQDIKIKRLKKDLGCSGIAVYDYILCEIYRVKGCFIVWDEHTAFDVSDYFNIKESTINEIVKYCCSLGLFNKELFVNGRVLSSSSIQQRYLDMCSRAKRKTSNIPEECIILPEESIKVPEESMIIPEESTQSKVKESKVKESIISEKFWIEQLCMKKRIDYDKMIKYLRTFLDDQELLSGDGKGFNRGIDEIKNHFVKWLNIQLSKDNVVSKPFKYTA